jgi:hypothetical protein
VETALFEEVVCIVGPLGLREGRVPWTGGFGFVFEEEYSFVCFEG